MYVACLKCGKEFPYDWSLMRIVHHGRRRGLGIAVLLAAVGLFAYIGLAR